jgi:hypothetical protein
VNTRVMRGKSIEGSSSTTEYPDTNTTAVMAENPILPPLSGE